ncbi:MAG: HDIG domain-containing protein [Prevotella sp.]|nr:HDIG domain-containing protein [Prevotella sp.]
MAINKKKEDRNLLGIFTRIVLILVSTALIVWALPGQTESRLYYEVGRPWIGSALIADFNYDVMRADSTIEREKEEITRDFEPFYVLDEKVEQRAIDDFCNNFTEENVGSLYAYKDQIVRRLHAIYSRPIMSATDYNSIFETDSSAVIRVSKDKELSHMHRINVYSESQAYKTLFFDEELEGHHSQLNKFNLENYIRPNIRYDKVRSEFELEQLLGNVATGIGKRVEQGEKIIDRGEIVTDTIAMKIDSMLKALNSDQAKDNKTIFANVLGQLLYVLMFITLFTIYLVKNNKNYFNKPRNILMLYAMIIIFPIMVSILARQSFLSVYILPLAMVPMLSQVFLDSHTAFITHVCVTMVSALAINDSFVFITIQLVAGLTAIFALSDMSKRAHLFKAAILVFVCSAITHYALQLIQTGKLTLDDKAYMVFFFNGILLLLTYPLMYIIEKAFGFTSNITLFELSDTNKDLLRRLSEVAPGTFQHSITVGNLASEIANRIDANGLLVRTGALYHDIGKMTNPVFFTENQANVNPHDKLNEKESAQIIISHVSEGQKLAEEYDLPVVIKNFILTHHGQGMAKYFYIKYKNAHPDEEIDTDLFSYPGPNPNTREQAILMMADAVEAASRSLDEYNDETIRNLVNKLVDGQVNAGFFTECPITFRDITTAKQVLVERLKNIYHTRIKYPELNKDNPDENKDQ